MSMAWRTGYTAGLSRFGLLPLRGEVHALEEGVEAGVGAGGAKTGETFSTV